MRPDSLLRFWRYINQLLTYLLYIFIHIITTFVEHARLLERLTSDKDEEMNSRLQQLEEQTTNSIEVLQQQHSEALNELNTGICSVNSAFYPSGVGKSRTGLSGRD